MKTICCLKKNVLAISMLLVFAFNAFSQSKYEREVRIKEKDVPKLALSFVDSLNFDSKLKWYKEFGLNSTSIEAKTKFKNENYSIEFYESGILQDVEIEIDEKKIDEVAFTNIHNTFAQSHTKYKIEKIQIQYTGDRNVILNFLRENRTNIESVTIKYEIIISTKKDGNFLWYEYLFSDTGQYLLRNQIITSRKDTIDY